VSTTRKNKYAGLTAKGPAASVNVRSSLRLTFPLNDDRRQVIDLTFFERGENPRKQLGESFAWYFRNALGGHSFETRSSKLYALRKFNQFLDWRAEGAGNISSTREITSDILLEYQLWLRSVCNISAKSAHYYYENLTRPLKVLRTHKPEIFLPDSEFPASEFMPARYEPSNKPAISLEELEKVAVAALKEVIQIRENHARAKKLLSKGEGRLHKFPPGSHRTLRWTTLADLLFYLVNDVGINSSPPYYVTENLRRNGLPSFNSVLNMYAPVSDRSLIPFLVLLFIRSAINVDSLYRLRRDCLCEHPLPLGLTILNFDKPRAGSARNKTIPFPTHQRNGVTDLIQFLTEYTAPWVPFARETEKDALLLFKSPGNGENEVRSPGANFAMRGLKSFIKQNNLPDFTFDQIRPAIATLIYYQTRDIFRVQRLLCHVDVTLTINYIKQEVVRRQHDIQIHDAIESIFSLLLDAPERVGKPAVFVQEIESVLRSKVSEGEVSPHQAEIIRNGGCSTGFARCRDPRDSPLPGELKGRVCRQLHKCVFCPNAWVFEEDLPKVIYFRDGLLADRKNLTESNWDELHGDAYREVTEEILPSFSSKVVEEATAKARDMFQPYPLDQEETCP
jgi:hypothetical protein